MTIIKEFVDSLLSRKPVVAPPQTYKGSAFDYLRETVDANGNAIFANSLSGGESAGKESRPGASRLSEALANVQDPKAGTFTRENFMDAVRSPRPHHHKPQDIDGITLRNITNSLDRYTKERELLALDRDKIDADIRGADSAIAALTVARDLLMDDRAAAAVEVATEEVGEPAIIVNTGPILPAVDLQDEAAAMGDADYYRFTSPLVNDKGEPTEI